MKIAIPIIGVITIPGGLVVAYRAWRRTRNARVGYRVAKSTRNRRQRNRQA